MGAGVKSFQASELIKRKHFQTLQNLARRNFIPYKSLIQSFIIQSFESIFKYKCSLGTQKY